MYMQIFSAGFRCSSALLMAAFMVVVSLPLQAAAPEPAEPYPEGSPHRLISDATKVMLGIIAEAQNYYDSDPDRYYREIEAVVDPMIDFPVFARSVMGKYASASRYRALKTEAEKTLFRDRVLRFSKTFKQGLIRTYGKGLLTFGGEEIEVLPPTEADLQKIAAGSSVTVIQHVHGSSGAIYAIKYKMKPDSSKAWKLRNVTIESINIGKVYRSQFESAMQQYKGDIDTVIDTWTVEPQEFKKKEPGEPPIDSDDDADEE